MPELARLTLDDVSALGDAIRVLGVGCEAMEDAATAVVRLLHERLEDGEGRPACALVRLYKTHPFARLPDELRRYASETAAEPLADDVRCLTLLGTVGDLPEWNDRRQSAGHRTIPLPSPELVRRLPMVSQLITQIGVDVDAVVRPEEAPLRELSQRSHDVFHVEQADGSPYVPAQDFVARHGIASAVGFGGMLHTGDFYAVVLFSKVKVSGEVAQALRLLALAVRIPLMRFLLGRVFAQR